MKTLLDKYGFKTAVALFIFTFLLTVAAFTGNARSDDATNRATPAEQSRVFKDVLGISCVSPLAAARIMGLRQNGEQAAADDLLALAKAGKPWCSDYSGLLNVGETTVLEPGREVEAICNPLLDPQPCRFTPLVLDLSTFKLPDLPPR